MLQETKKKEEKKEEEKKPPQKPPLSTQTNGRNMSSGLLTVFSSVCMPLLEKAGLPVFT